MYKINTNYQKLPGSYLFSNIAKKVNAFTEAHPEADIIRLGIGDVTQPIAPAMIEAMHKAVDEMGDAKTFHGYAPDLGYAFLRDAIVAHDYQARGCDISADEIFVSDGAKSDSGNIQEIFSVDNRIAVCDPVYPVYVDSNVMAGRTGVYDANTQMWSNVIYMPCTAENNFVPEFPKENPDIIYLCLPNNPIFPRAMWRIPSMNVREQRPVRSRSAVFQRMQDLPAFVLALRSYQRIWYVTAFL